MIRHGRSLGDDENRIEGAGWDAPLTATGVKQAQLLAERLLREGYQFDVLYSSPLQRAKRVAEIVAEKLELEIVFDKRLEEMHTGFLGGMTFAEAESIYPEPEGGWRSYDRIPEGECPIDQLARVMRFYAELVDKHMQDSVCVITHGGTVDCLLNIIYGLPQNSPFSYKGRYRFRTGDTSMHRLTINGPQDVVTHFLNDTSHLK